MNFSQKKSAFLVLARAYRDSVREHIEHIRHGSSDAFWSAFHVERFREDVRVYRHFMARGKQAGFIK